MSVGIEGMSRSETKSGKLRMSCGMDSVVGSWLRAVVQSRRCEGCLLSPTSLPNRCSRRRQQRVPAVRLDDVRWSSGRSVPRVDLGDPSSLHHSTLSASKFNVLLINETRWLGKMVGFSSFSLRLEDIFSTSIMSAFQKGSQICVLRRPPLASANARPAESLPPHQLLDR